MLTLPEKTKLITAFADEFEALVNKILDAGTEHHVLNYMLVRLTNETAMKGGPQAYFDHCLWTQAEGKRLLSEFEARYGDKLEMNELAKGILVAKSG
ncbi:hypothetical protein [uncultured Roseobacter sp.]|uniref:hypothetical protein n=1 Tax=uncultured Roseobacter sp. TaxID=114847 RepID=UPI002622EDA9|nr:hypothetical protein [uncultured Roseobacter sp.]